MPSSLSAAPRLRLLPYEAGVFAAAFLLFAAQPSVAKALLPYLGGSALVWSSALAVFQGLLLAGYAAADRLLRVRHARAAGLGFCALLLAAGGWGWGAGPLWPPPPEVADGDPVSGCVRAIVGSVGVPVFLLAMASPLLGRWLSLSSLAWREDPAALYSASNAGSLGGLLAFPFCLERWWSLGDLESGWWMGVGLLGLGLLPVAAGLPVRVPPDCAGQSPRTGAGRSRRLAGAVLLLSGGGSMLLVATTSLVARDLSAVPMVGSLPLAVYLLTYAVAFGRRAEGPGRWSGGFHWIAGMALAIYLMGEFRLGTESPAGAVGLLGLLYAACVVAHGALARLRPRCGEELARFYLWIGCGGFAGGAAAAWLAPLWAAGAAEYPLALGAIAAGLALAGGREREGGRCGLVRALGGPAVVAATAWLLLPALNRMVPEFAGRAAFPLAGFAVLASAVAAGRSPGRLAAVAASVLAFVYPRPPAEPGVSGAERYRSPYGFYTLYERGGRRFLRHGNTVHGAQDLAPERAGIPLTYYHPTTPVGRFFRLPRTSPQRVAMIGLGAGALAAYAGPGDSWTIFELDPLDIRLAETRFTYLERARAAGATVRVASGDGRVRAREEAAGSCDILVIDAFSSGAIPVHLLTEEALGDYGRMLSGRGWILLHLSNRMLDLGPVVEATARRAGWQAVFADNAGSVADGADLTQWAGLNREVGEIRAVQQALGWTAAGIPPEELPRAWTDGWSNVFVAVLARIRNG